jgi:hypothetical protein
MNNGGREALLHHLLSFDLSRINLRKIPRTAALVEQQIASLTPDQAWWLDVLSRGELPGLCGDCCCNSQALYEHYTRRLERSGRTRKSMETGLGIFLRKAIGPDFTDQRVVQGQHRFRRYTFPSLVECRRRFAEMMRADLAWDEQQTWENDVGAPI